MTESTQLPIRKLQIGMHNASLMISETGQKDKAEPLNNRDYLPNGRIKKAYWRDLGYENCILHIKDSDLDIQYKVKLTTQGQQ